MNKQEYMYNLFEALRPFDEDVRNEIISDYELLRSINWLVDGVEVVD